MKRTFILLLSGVCLACCNLQAQLRLQFVSFEDMISQFNLGFMYKRGKDTDKNDSQAVAWYTKAAEQDYAKAQCTLGLMYLWGDGVEKNKATSIEWLQKAAENGNEEAKDRLTKLQ